MASSVKTAGVSFPRWRRGIIAQRHPQFLKNLRYEQNKQAEKKVGYIRALERAQRVQKVKQYKIRNIWNYIIVTIHENITTKDNNNNNQLIVWVSWKFLCWLTASPFDIFHDKQKHRQLFGLRGMTHKRQYMFCYLTKTKKKKFFGQSCIDM